MGTPGGEVGLEKHIFIKKKKKKKHLPKWGIQGLKSNRMLQIDVENIFAALLKAMCNPI